MNEEYDNLKIGSKCPKCELGKQGLSKSTAIELALTGWENYDFLHCDICGQFYVCRKENKIWIATPIRPIESE